MAMKGSDILLKKGAVASSAVTIGGFRTTSFTINSETVDITSSDSSNRWRKLLAAAGVKSMSISMSGVLKDDNAHEDLIEDTIAQTVDDYRMTVGALGVITGKFQMTQFEGAGEYNGEQTYSITLESGDDITFATA
jgi:TP901-1 family phage major tail protein